MHFDFLSKPYLYPSMAKSKTYKAALAKMPTAAGIFEIMQPIMAYNSKMGDKAESHWLLGFNGEGCNTILERLGDNEKAASDMEPKEVYRMAVYCDSNFTFYVRCIAATRKKKGVLMPTWEDMNRMEKLVLVGEVIDITVLDYLVMDKENFFSMAKFGLLRKPDFSDLIAQGREPGTSPSVKSMLQRQEEKPVPKKTVKKKAVKKVAKKK
jgi:RadC-like JAB domain